MSIFILGGGSATTAYYVPALRLMGRPTDATIVDSDADAIKSHQLGLGEVKYCAQDYASFLKMMTAPRENKKVMSLLQYPTSSTSAQAATLRWLVKDSRLHAQNSAAASRAS